METLRLLSTTQQVDPALFGEEYSDYIDVTEENIANQFRITEDNEANADATLKSFTFPSPQTGLKGNVSVAWSIKNGNNCDN